MQFRNASHDYLTCLWQRLQRRLTSWRRDWEKLITPSSAPANTGEVLGHEPLSDARIFEAFALALLSGNTRWDRIARILGELRSPFLDFQPERFAWLTDGEIELGIVPWFRERRAGSAGLRAGLLRLRETAARLSGHGQVDSGAHTFLRAARANTDGSPEDLALLLGTSKDWKLPGFGIALAAEALRNLGLDLCKPDRHILRAVGSWSLVRFARWDRRGAFTAPQASTPELKEAMFAVRSIADANDVSVSYANSVIWTAGAVSGARLDNGEFRAVARECGQPQIQSA